MGTFGGALEARDIDAGGGKLQADAVGEVEKEGGVLILKRIHVSYLLQAADSDREKIERVHDKHARFCPVYRSIEGSIEVTTRYRLKRPRTGR